MPPIREKHKSVQLSKEFGGLFNYDLSVQAKPEKVDDMYPLKWTGFDHSDVQTGINKVLGPLTLFAPFTHEDATPPVQQLQFERPVTPIDEEIKVQPKTIEKMMHHIRKRVMAKPNIPFLSVEDQKNLVAIIMGEVNGIWPDIKRQIEDPFLTVGENKELSRRIAVHIVAVCEKLFHHYLKKAQVLNGRGVFTGPANMSRLKVQLALEAGELLNVLKIQRYIVKDIRMSAVLWKEAERDTSCSSTKLQKIKTNTVEHEIREMQNIMPVLDTSNLMELLAELPERDIQLARHEEHHLKPSHMTQGALHESGVIKEDTSKQKTFFKRSHSQPMLNEVGNLLDELGIDCKVKRDNLIELELRLLQREREGMKRVEVDKETKVQFDCNDFIKNDLKKLTEYKKDEILDGNIEGDMPPLIQAIIRHSRHDDLKQRMEKQLIELEEKQRMRDEEECVHVQGPTHPQPDTVSAKLGNAGVVRTSDIRVSERVCMSSVTLRRHATLYNDLLDEIDQVTVKNLDTNLFLSDEIQEVYKEIMKTVPATHMELDDLIEKDPLVVNAPESVDLTSTMASATLSHKVLNRIINPTLTRNREPPWTGSSMKEWARRGEDMFAANTLDMTNISEALHSIGQNMQTDKLSFAEEKKSRALVLSWKSTLSNDDYMKYLASQETDFLGAVFHFYDSEEDDDDESESEVLTNKLHHFSWRTKSKKGSKLNAEQKEKLRKLEELQNLKSEYKKGFWNANTVLMGGLGKDPELEAENKLNRGKASTSLESGHQKLASHVRMTSGRRSRAKTTTGASELRASTTEGPAFQERLENVWQKLQMPDSQRLDMAIKYSCNNYFNKLSEAIERWEFASELILQRETLLTKLEKFERQASDPNRFFDRDSKNSIYRLEESRQRTYLYKKMDALDISIKEVLECIHNQFHDVVTYKGRPYSDKIKWDRTEMLYWLSEERKQNGLKYEAMLQGLDIPLRPAHLQPIISSKTLQL